jgi:hypothetical protein
MEKASDTDIRKSAFKVDFQKKVLADKSAAAVSLAVFTLAAGVLSIVLCAVAFQDADAIWQGFLYLILAIAVFAYSILEFVRHFQLKNPAIEYDETGIYINFRNKTEFIPFARIDDFRSRNIYSRLKTYRFGTLRIFSGEKEFVLHHIDNIGEVTNALSALIALKTGKIMNF